MSSDTDLASYRLEWLELILEERFNLLPRTFGAVSSLPNCLTLSDLAKATGQSAVEIDRELRRLGKLEKGLRVSRAEFDRLESDNKIMLDLDRDQPRPAKELTESVVGCLSHDPKRAASAALYYREAGMDQAFAVKSD